MVDALEIYLFGLSGSTARSSMSPRSTRYARRTRPSHSKIKEQRVDTVKLAKVLGMLGSSHEPEVVVAARTAQEMLHVEGLSWADVVAVKSGADEWRDSILAVEQRLHRLPNRDQVVFLQLRERYFARGTLDEADGRRLSYFGALADSGNDLPF